MTTSQALSIAMASVICLKNKAIEDAEKFNQDVFVPALEELGRENGIEFFPPGEPVLLEDERPSKKFEEALEVLDMAFNEFQEFEEVNGEEEVWQLEPAQLLGD